MEQKAVVVNIRGRKPQAIADGEIYIGRAIGMGGWCLDRSIWANPFTGERAEVIKKYDAWIRAPERAPLRARLDELAGKRLCCWCAPDPCHGDVLLKLLSERSA